MIGNNHPTELFGSNSKMRMLRENWEVPLMFLLSFKQFRWNFKKYVERNWDKTFKKF